jgi:spermidine/putrescine transport system substrate-binding protein
VSVDEPEEADERELRAFAQELHHERRTGVYHRRGFIQGASGLLLVSGLTGLLSACGGDEDGDGAAGTIGGTLTLLSWAGYESEEAAAPFTRKYGVKVTATAMDDTEQILTKTKSGSRFDMASPNTGYVPAFTAAGILQPVDWSRIPNTRNYLPAIVEQSASVKVDGEYYFAPYIWGVDELVYDASASPTPPRSWEDIFDGRFEGKLVFQDTAPNNIIIWAKVLGFDPLKLTQPQLDEVTDYLIDVKKQHIRGIAASPNDIADQMARGDVAAVAGGAWPAIAGFANEKGGNVSYTVPKEGTYRWIDTWVIMKEAENLETAYAWLNHMLTPKAQAIVAQEMLSATTVKGAVPLLDPELSKLYPYDDSSLTAQRIFPYGFPPDTGEYTTLDDWTKAWEQVKAA